MARESTVFGASTLLVTAGLLVLLYGVAASLDGVMSAGGVVGLVGVAVMALYLARMEAPEEEAGH